jgi:hypothetical protein
MATRERWEVDQREAVCGANDRKWPTNVAAESAGTINPCRTERILR